MLRRPVGAIATAESEGGWHLMEVLKESEPPQSHAPAPVRARMQTLSVAALSDILADPDQVRSGGSGACWGGNMLDRGAAQVEVSQFVDVREQWEHDTAQLPHFQLYALSDLGEWLPTIADVLDPERPTYVLCHHGVRSMQAANMLLMQGFQDVHNVSGGIAAWSSAVDTSVPRY